MAGFGGTDVLKVGEVGRPEPGEGEVLIRVVAAGVNRADLLQRQGHYPPPAGASETLGLEVAGEIVARGPGAEARWKTGDRVCALVLGGGYAEYCVADHGCCLPVPASMALEAAASLPEAVFTVWANLFDPRRLFAGDRFLMQGGTSGIGTMAIQPPALEQRWRQAGSAGKSVPAGTRPRARLHYREENWVAGALEWPRQRRGCGSWTWWVAIISRSIWSCGPKTRLVHIATAHGNEVNLDLRTVMAKRLVITGSTLRSRSVAEKTRLRDGLEECLWPLVREGNVRPVVDQVFTLEAAAKAHERMESSFHIGKIVLKVA